MGLLGLSLPSKKDIMENKDAVLGEISGVFFIVFFFFFVRMTTLEPFVCGSVVFLTYSMNKYGSYKFSKAHFNPAVSIAYYLLGEINSLQVVLYVLAQLAASAGAGVLLLLLSAFKINRTGIVAGCPWKGTFKYNGVDTDTAGYFQSKSSF